jgi:hypothetical protein
MKTLPNFVKRWGCEWTQLEREGNLALFHQVGIDDPQNMNRGANNFVVIRVRKRAANEKFDTPAKEDLPSANEYGRYAWNYINERDAREHFETLCRSDEN